MTANNCFAEFLHQMDSLNEGAGTVLDRSDGEVWFTDHGYARTHTMDNVPIMTAGLAGGRLKGGIHISAVGDPRATRMEPDQRSKAMGVPIKTNWGTRCPTRRQRPSPKCWPRSGRT